MKWGPTKRRCWPDLRRFAARCHWGARSHNSRIGQADLGKRWLVHQHPDSDMAQAMSHHARVVGVSLQPGVAGGVWLFMRRDALSAGASSIEPAKFGKARRPAFRTAGRLPNSGTAYTMM